MKEGMVNFKEEARSQLLRFAFDPHDLNALAARYHDSYASASPFPHVVMDKFLPEDVLDAILEEFPDPKKIDWLHLNHDNSKKLASRDLLQIGGFTRHVISELNSSVFITFLEKLAGIDGLVPDPHLWGGGLHQIERGGYLNIHADFNRHPKLKLDRRLNLLLYLNKDWKEGYGGHLELWNRQMTRCEIKVLPLFNRCVIFSTTDFSFHGHPVPLTCPEGWTRKSLALYYYTNGRPLEERTSSHSTLYRHPGIKESNLMLILRKVSRKFRTWFYPDRQAK